MLRSPTDKSNITYGSAPDLNQGTDDRSPDACVTLRSSKRRRCDCGSSDESKLDVFINKLTSWKQDTDSKLTGILESMNDIKKQNAELLASNAEIEKSINFLSEKYDDICEQINNQQERIKAFDLRLSSAEEATEENNRLSRANSLEIRNLPIKQNLPQEELIRTCDLIFKELGTEVAPRDVYDIRILPSKQESKTVIVTLNSVILKNCILRAYKDFNKSNPHGKLSSSLLGPNYPRQVIYMSENLTARTRRLFYLAREFAKAENYKHCWTANGRVLLRQEDNGRLIVLNSDTQITQLTTLKSKN
ncbi:uncharacterized protein LOC114358544 [Ostrinia furnacalis]|uniref:uncharacterized protein LOC114358544 n=1 Tax=Ostrinia furnacalis TaxID=93504 RepID=UPI00103A216C|nr:uncharacterized protein LOC114358544 [Ostrinia furnacalis]